MLMQLSGVLVGPLWELGQVSIQQLILFLQIILPFVVGALIGAGVAASGAAAAAAAAEAAATTAAIGNMHCIPRYQDYSTAEIGFGA